MATKTAKRGSKRASKSPNGQVNGKYPIDETRPPQGDDPGEAPPLAEGADPGTAVIERPQMGFWDRELDDEIAEALIRDVLEIRAYLKKHKYGSKTKKMRELPELIEIKDGESVRIGKFVLTGGTRAGGGHSVDTWERRSIKAIRTID